MCDLENLSKIDMNQYVAASYNGLPMCLKVVLRSIYISLKCHEHKSPILHTGYG
jgi:hypothetical protein